jgi:hypothetical protein
MLHAGGAYKNYDKPQRPFEKEYGQYFVDVQNYRVDEAKKLFKNHYDYLVEWYGKI